MHLFEFNDLPVLPESIRATLRDLCELCNSGFRSFNHEVAKQVLDRAREQGSRTIVELGAGTAPITRILAADPAAKGMTLVPCDLLPDLDAYRELAAAHPDSVRPCEESVDYTRPKSWGPGSIAVLVGTFHHIDPRDRDRTLAALSKSADHVMVFEPLRNTPFSMLLSTTAVVPALLLPLAYLGKPGRLRRFLWCWLVPVVPFIFFWDGLVSCMRQWSPKTWLTRLGLAAPTRQPTIDAGLHSLTASW